MSRRGKRGSGANRPRRVQSPEAPSPREAGPAAGEVKDATTAAPMESARDDRVRFAIVFVTIAAVLLAVYYFPRGTESAGERWTSEYLRFYTRLAGFAISLFDRTASTHGNLVTGRFSMQIVKSCDAMEANILFTAAILAFAASWRRKVVALVVGLAALVAFNLARLFVLYWVGVFIYPAFEFMHYDLWPLLMIAFAALDFVVCIRWMLPEPATPLNQGSGHAAG